MREFGLYFVERIFDYSSLILAYLASNEELTCKACGEMFSHEQLDAVKLYGLTGPKCRQGTVWYTETCRPAEFSFSVSASFPATLCSPPARIRFARPHEIGNSIGVGRAIGEKKARAPTTRGSAGAQRPARRPPPAAAPRWMSGRCVPEALGRRGDRVDPPGERLRLPEVPAWWRGVGGAYSRGGRDGGGRAWGA